MHLKGLHLKGRERETDGDHPSVVPFFKCPQQLEQDWKGGIHPRHPDEGQEHMYPYHHPLHPRVHISRRRESESELGIEPQAL